MKTRRKRIRDMMSVAALLLALLVPSAAKGQSDNFFYIDESEYRGGDDVGTGSWLGLGDNTGGTGSWMNFDDDTGGEATWVGFEDGDPLPTGTGLLVMALSGFCYGAARARRGKKRD